MSHLLVLHLFSVNILCHKGQYRLSEHPPHAEGSLAFSLHVLNPDVWTLTLTQDVRFQIQPSDLGSRCPSEVAGWLSLAGREKCVLLWFKCFSLSGVCDETERCSLMGCIWNNERSTKPNLAASKPSWSSQTTVLTASSPPWPTSSTLEFSYWAERLGEWWAPQWPWAAPASMQVCVPQAEVLPHPTEQKHTKAWARSSLLIMVCDQSWWIWLLLACLLHNFPQTCSFCFCKLQQLRQRQTDALTPGPRLIQSVCRHGWIKNRENSQLYCNQFQILHAFFMSQRERTNFLYECVLHFVGLTISMCCCLNEKPFYWLFKCYNGQKFAGGAKKCSTKLFSFHVQPSFEHWHATFIGMETFFSQAGAKWVFPYFLI